MRQNSRKKKTSALSANTITGQPEAMEGPISEAALKKAALGQLCDLVVQCRCAYSDCAELIENRAYEEWKRGRFEKAVDALARIASFFENLENKSEENVLDLADIYLLIGQMYQFAEWHPECIEWFSKSVFANDGNSLPYHLMAVSYMKTGNTFNAIRCFEQELAIDEGNYFTYLSLADLYCKDGKLEKAEECLKRLLTRDPENIQALHQLIRHYELHNPSIDVGLLRKRLLGIDQKHTWTSAVIRSYHLSAEHREAEAIAFLSAWQLHTNGHSSPVVHLAKAALCNQLGREQEVKNELFSFRDVCNSREKIMRGHVEEFVGLFGHESAALLKNNLSSIIS
ncbi:MAG: tetratricopeptide repeat protein [Chitinispirillaceae bacterium]|nr:tetratricopeptide repeat protein [Chitinispirillaceae bacterium]